MIEKLQIFDIIFFLFIFILGYFGDGMPVYSGTTSLVKTHGYFNTPVTNMRDLQSKPNDTEWMMEVTRGTGIVLIRNPFRVLYSFRNYNVMGLWGHADATKFTGPGILQSSSGNIQKFYFHNKTVFLIINYLTFIQNGMSMSIFQFNYGRDFTWNG